MLSPSAAELSQINVSQINPEQLLVHAATIEPGGGGVSVDNIDEALLRCRPEHTAVGPILPCTLIALVLNPPSELDRQGQPAHGPPQTTEPSTSPPARLPRLSPRAVQLRQHPHRHAQHAHIRRHHAAMEGYNVFIFAYGQIASGEMFTLSDYPDEPGIIPRAMRDAEPGVPPALQLPGGIQRGSPRPSWRVRGRATGADPANGALAPLRDEVVTRLVGVRAVLTREEGNRRKTNGNGNKRNSRSRSVFRMAMESCGRGLGGRVQVRDIATSRTPVVRDCRRGKGGGSTLSLIDLAGSETSREGKYINTSLLTLGSVIGTLTENTVKGKSYIHSFIFTFNWRPRPLPQLQALIVAPALPLGLRNHQVDLHAPLKRIKWAARKAEKKEVVDTDAILKGDAQRGAATKMASLFQNEWSVVEEGEADMSFEHHAPTSHGLSKFSKRFGMGSTCIDVLMCGRQSEAFLQSAVTAPHRHTRRPMMLLQIHFEHSSP
ncbi:P-loop containing nucleoside triphosphate hydrolase protein [Athelia psychrophila]|uniref:P-loop containing nucleoside triphosphate hydrolase protein n=1 Tax=Athelia psychrophila TaxID=1759441 RepID=A0A166CI91_9AGAM|nr:P-loop containing nucleoside triphosphate hydrolase protein [Fibularhizoctonia sp. CBS 109695]